VSKMGAHDIRNEPASLLPPSVPFYETLDEFLKNYKADLKLVEGRMTSVPAMLCSEIQGSATFEFLHNGVFGQGIIETNWTLGLNRKITQLFYCSSNTRVTLHHSDETVYVHRDGRLIFTKSLKNRLPRLTNHYINVNLI